MAGSARALDPKSKEPLQSTSPDLPLEERVRQRAHEIYLQRGGADGNELDDWLQAEEELRQAGDAE